MLGGHTLSSEHTPKTINYMKRVSRASGGGRRGGNVLSLKCPMIPGSIQVIASSLSPSPQSPSEKGTWLEVRGHCGVASWVCHPNDLFVTANRTMKTRVLLRSPQTTGTTMLNMGTLVAFVTFVKVTLGSGEEVVAADLGRS